MSEYAPYVDPDPQGEQAEPAKRKRMPGWVWILLALCVILAAALIFVTVNYLAPANSRSDTGQSQPAPSTSEKTPPAETTKPSAPAPIVLPTCEQLLPDAFTRAAALSARLPEAEIRYGDVGFDRFPEHFGPATQTALNQTSQSLGCGYPDSLESYIHAYVSELSGAAKDTFLEALRADGDFVESTIGKAQVFVWEDPLEEGGHWASAFTVHAFVGDVWVVGYGNRPAEDYIPTATAAILAANPGLG